MAKFSDFVAGAVSFSASALLHIKRGSEVWKRVHKAYNNPSIEETLRWLVQVAEKYEDDLRAPASENDCIDADFEDVSHDK